MKKIEIRQEPTELFKILKFEGLVGSGGEAKALIGTGGVQVNGDVELRKRRKMTVGDVLSIYGKNYEIVLEQE